MAWLGLCGGGTLTAFNYISPGCSFYEAHFLGGCARVPPRPECAAPAAAHRTTHRLGVIVPYRGGGLATHATLSHFCERSSARGGICHAGSGGGSVGAGAAARVLLVNQTGSAPFNRGALANIGFELLSRGERLDYLAVHDVDRVPAVDNASCAGAISGYYLFPGATPRVLHPKSYTGGVLVIAASVYRAVNGFSNAFWGWGHEDNELFGRLRWCGLVPRQGKNLDACMVHEHCQQCKHSTAAVRVEDTAALLHETRNIALLQRRLDSPQAAMATDGIRQVSYEAEGRPRRVRCGSCRLQVIDVPAGVIDEARRALSRRASFVRVAAASRARVLHNYRYEVDMEVVMGGAGRVALQRVAVCDHAWQREEMRERYGVPRYTALWRAAVSHNPGNGSRDPANLRKSHRPVSGRRLEAGGMSPHIQIVRRFRYRGPFACDIVR
ncbi:hypothetical protein EMIHUDRAFT_197985 [Emiliania huxleyi CCMP1516]|uniref:Galactosyltransferase C-terminal domain-containing protein n=2 Tax=Emiliania huxleyi TaxID=2903 RepID=A0A0D3IE26_EMIH1|nr:hypothetical protein EMIHUDRAFT_197985 [Emiliania huxleyi CCMP1516]EOD09511.1 hypothetical protein EMIHUDRAFT_197985 [Emiliania huxleyi CCMP1516]|eukprot:XP_005761940.1 hypothetical protein EMIHUDRAFT_197985 [Emiliania huxleyi CCMP1516]